MAEQEDHIVLRELSYEVMAAAFEVQNTLGSGFLEKVYENAMVEELRRRGIKVEQQKETRVLYKGVSVGLYYADFLVNDEILVELKAPEFLTKAHQAQILNYLKATGKRLGLLINFGNNKVEHKRFII